MPDEKEAFETARFVRVESAFSNGAIETATTELRLDTYKQIQNCFLGLCIFFGLITLLMQHTDFHEQMTLARQKLLHSAADSSASKDIETNALNYSQKLTAYQVRLDESERKYGTDSTLLIPTISRLAALNTQLDRMPEAELLYKRSQTLIQKYNHEQGEPSANAK